MDTRQEQGAALIDALEEVLRPLMPLFLNFGVSHHDLSQMLGRVFVYAIAERLKAQGRPTTIARLSLMTSINRGLVEKYLQERAGSVSRRQANIRAISTPATVLSMWHDDRRFGTPYGAPLDLDLDVNMQRSFQSLVNAVAPGLDWETVLDELQAAGCVEVVNEQFVRCTSRVFIPSGIRTEHIARVGEIMGRLASNFTHNLLREEGQPKYLERQVVSEYPLSADGEGELRTYLESNVPPVLEQFDRWLTAQQDRLQSTAGRRIGVSMFMYEVEDESKSSTSIKAATA